MLARNFESWHLLSLLISKKGTLLFKNGFVPSEFEVEHKIEFKTGLKHCGRALGSADFVSGSESSTF